MTYIIYVCEGFKRRRTILDIAISAVGLVRRGANLPHFKIYPIPEGDSLAGKLAMQWISKAQSQGEILRFDDQQDFSKRFTVLFDRPEWGRSRTAST